MQCGKSADLIQLTTQIRVDFIAVVGRLYLMQCGATPLTPAVFT